MCEPSMKEVQGFTRTVGRLAANWHPRIIEVDHVMREVALIEAKEPRWKHPNLNDD